MKKEILLSILQITQLQTNALQIEDIESWSELLNQRQQYIDQLEAINKESQNPNTPEEKEILKQIVDIDTTNRQEFDRQYNEVQQNLKKIRSQKRIGNVYSNPYDISQEEGIFFDKR